MQHDICLVISYKLFSNTSSSHRLLGRLVPILATAEIFCKPSPEIRTCSSSAIAVAMLREGQLMRGLLLGGGDGGRRGRHLGLPRVDDVLHATHLAGTLASRSYALQVPLLSVTHSRCPLASFFTFTPS